MLGVLYPLVLSYNGNTEVYSSFIIYFKNRYRYIWFRFLFSPYTDPPATINIDDCDIPVFFTLMINGWPVRVCTTPYWMVGGWFVHYGVSVLMCAVFGDFYWMPNLELWVFPFLAHYLGPVSLASLPNKCFAAS